MRPHRRARVAAAIAGAAMLFAALGPATAAAAAVVPDAGGDRVLTVTGTVSAVAGGSPGSIAIDIPEGFVPTRLTGTTTPQNPGESQAVVYVDQIAAGSVPTDRDYGIDLPLDESQVEDGTLTVGLRYEVPSAETAACPSSDIDLVTLSGIRVVLSGTVQPLTSVGDFFSSTVSTVSVIIPDDPSQQEREAGLIAVGAVAKRYALPVIVTLTTESDTANRPEPDPLFGRIVRIETTDAFIGAELISDGTSAPELLLSGRADELSAAASGLASEFLQLANSTAVEGPFATVAPVESLSFTLEELGVNDIELHGYGRAETSIGIRQSQFGGPVSSVDVHLTGMHSAIDDGIAASIQLYWNDQLVASEMLDSDPTFDVSFTLSSAYVNASNTLAVQLNSVPPGADCGSISSAIIPLDLSVNGKASTVSAERGQGLPAGFQRFPQTLANHLPVAFSAQGDPADLVAAAGCIVVALQRVNVQQLVVTVPSLSDFVASADSGVVVGATPDDARALTAPLRFSEFKSIDQSNGSFAVGVAEPFAAAEAFQQNDRDVLMVGGYSPDGSSDAVTSGLVLQVADQIANGQYGWDGLYNDLFILTSSGDEAVIFESDGLAPNPDVVASYSQQAWWVLIALAVAVAVIAIAAASLAARRRRVRRIVDGQEHADVSRRTGSADDDDFHLG